MQNKLLLVKIDTTCYVILTMNVLVDCYQWPIYREEILPKRNHAAQITSAELSAFSAQACQDLGVLLGPHSFLVLKSLQSSQATLALFISKGNKIFKVAHVSLCILF